MSTSAVPTFFRHAAWLLLLLVPRTASAGDVHVVDAQGGGDHLTIQAGVDAAASGDIVLVKPGTYSAFSVIGKGLSVIADGAPVLVDGGISVQDTLAGQPVLLAGLESQGTKVVEQEHPALVLLDTAGAVRVEDCELRGAPGNNTDCGPFSCPGTQGLGGAAVTLTRAHDVAFVRCQIEGGPGWNNLIHSQVDGGHGVLASGSRVAFHECALRGGAGGGFQAPWLGFADGGDGGHGILAQDEAPHLMIVHFSGTELVGGDGGMGADCIDPSGAGGHGAKLARIGPGTRGLRLDSTFAGGIGGCGVPPGEPLVLEGGALMTTLPGVARQASVASPVREQQPMLSSFRGLPGDQVFLARAPQPDFIAQPAAGGVLYLQQSAVSQRVFMGTIPAGGILDVAISAPSPGAGAEGATLFLQAIFRDAASSSWLSAPATPVVLDSAF